MSKNVYYSCACSSLTTGQQYTADGSSTEEVEDQPFDPTSLRANYALYPLQYLLFCNDCHDLRCPKCYYEEALYYFCPSCLLETQSSTVKNETNRCGRSCFQCPLCMAPLSINSFQTAQEARQTTENPAKRDGPFILSCNHCAWSTLEIGIRFEKSINVLSQLNKLPNGADLGITSGGDKKAAEASFEDALNATLQPTADDRFTKLASFYRDQLEETGANGSTGASGLSGLDSPSHLTRLLSNYGVKGLRKQKGRLPVMREPRTRDEGLELEDETEDAAIIQKMANLGWDDVTDVEQRSAQSNDARFFTDVRPNSTKLRSKRAKRCKTCRNNLIRPDDKRQSVRYKIRLLALNYIPSVSILPLNAAALGESKLSTGRTVQYKITFRNPLFDGIRIVLATPRVTPGPIQSRVTILCPQFEVGASSDVWDEALDAGKRRVTQGDAKDQQQQPEAGKVWEKGRNWTTIIMELVPGIKPTGAPVGMKIEVPVFVRMEYETQDAATAGVGDGKSSRAKTKRELSWWNVLDVGTL